MDKIPLFPKIILNIFLYFLYVFIVSLIFSFLFPQILLILWKPILDPSDPFFYKTQVMIAVFLLFFTMIFRKYVYISINSFEESDQKNTSIQKKETKKKDIFSQPPQKDISSQKNKDVQTWEDIGIKIYIDKEIK